MCLRPGRRPTGILNPMDQGAHSSKPRHCLLPAAHVPLPIETGYLKRMGRPGQARPRGALQGAQLPVQLVPEVFSDRRASKSVVMHRHLRASVLDNKRASLHAWQDWLRDPSLTALLVLQVFLLFVALPLAATGVPIAQLVAWLLLLLAVTLVVILSQRGVAIVTILLGLVAAAASFALGREWSPITASVLNHGGFTLAFSALIWVVAHALYAPGRITFHRLQGAMVVYLSLATIFANAFGLVWQLVPGAFANLPPAAPGASEFATMLYFSLATLTTTGYGDIVPLNPFARSLANLESVIGPFYLAITVARLVTMELEDRRRSRQ